MKRIDQRKKKTNGFNISVHCFSNYRTIQKFEISNDKKVIKIMKKLANIIELDLSKFHLIDIRNHGVLENKNRIYEYCKTNDFYLFLSKDPENNILGSIKGCYRDRSKIPGSFDIKKLRIYNKLREKEFKDILENIYEQNMGLEIKLNQLNTRVDGLIESLKKCKKKKAKKDVHSFTFGKRNHFNKKKTG